MAEGHIVIAETAAKLRAPFPDSEIGKLPRIWCPECRKQPSKACSNHPAAKCRDCGNKHSSAALHLDYVGHAETTDRLLSVDPDWNWEPVALDAAGLPALDRNGGLWIRLTVAGVSRLGYGNAEGKSGGDAVKEIIGDAIRNASMRFGVALDLWRKTERAEQAAEHTPPPVRTTTAAPAAKPDLEPPAQPEPAPVAPEPVRPAERQAAPAAREDGRPLTDSQLRHIQTLFSKGGFKVSAARHAFIKEHIGVTVASTNELTIGEASRLVDALNAHAAAKVSPVRAYVGEDPFLAGLPS
jgi:hypothetical protein